MMNKIKNLYNEQNTSGKIAMIAVAVLAVIGILSAFVGVTNPDIEKVVFNDLNEAFKNDVEYYDDYYVENGNHVIQYQVGVDYALIEVEYDDDTVVSYGVASSELDYAVNTCGVIKKYDVFSKYGLRNATYGDIDYYDGNYYILINY